MPSMHRCRERSLREHLPRSGHQCALIRPGPLGGMLPCRFGSHGQRSGRDSWLVVGRTGPQAPRGSRPGELPLNRALWYRILSSVGSPSVYCLPAAEIGSRVPGHRGRPEGHHLVGATPLRPPPLSRHPARSLRRIQGIPLVPHRRGLPPLLPRSPSATEDVGSRALWGRSRGKDGVIWLKCGVGLVWPEYGKWGRLPRPDITYLIKYKTQMNQSMSRTQDESVYCREEEWDVVKRRSKCGA